jgi:hypothetical protein
LGRLTGDGPKWQRIGGASAGAGEISGERGNLVLTVFEWGLLQHPFLLAQTNNPAGQFRDQQQGLPISGRSSNIRPRNTEVHLAAHTDEVSNVRRFRFSDALPTDRETVERLGTSLTKFDFVLFFSARWRVTSDQVEQQQECKFGDPPSCAAPGRSSANYVL